MRGVQGRSRGSGEMPLNRWADVRISRRSTSSEDNTPPPCETSTFCFVGLCTLFIAGSHLFSRVSQHASLPPASFGSRSSQVRMQVYNSSSSSSREPLGDRLPLRGIVVFRTHA